MVRLTGRPVDAPTQSASSATGAADSAPTTLDALASAIPHLREAAKRRRGTLVVTEAPPALASRVDVWGPVSAPDVMRRLKQQFDPHGILNPGRFACGL
jgi:glycolate oxidase FAD binding subunit